MSKKKKHIYELNYTDWAGTDTKLGEMQAYSPREYTQYILKNYRITQWQKNVMLAFLLGVKLHAIAEEYVPNREYVEGNPDKFPPGWTPDIGSDLKTPSWMWRDVYFVLMPT